MIELRRYQSWTIEQLFAYFQTHSGNPVVAMPTGTGKSIIIAETLRRAFSVYPAMRAMMLTHVKELIAQNFAQLLQLWPQAPAGIYSAGLKRRDYLAPITFAGIASVYKKPALFGHIDLLLIDECHLVSPSAVTTYQQFIRTLLDTNPRLRVIGFSATPYRLGHGMLTDAGALFTDVAVDLTSRDAFNHLLNEGWLAPLIPKKMRTELDVSGVRVQGGEYVMSELQDAVDTEAVTYAALCEAREYAHDRKHWLVFTTGIQHTEHVAGQLVDLGIEATFVHSKLPGDERDRRIKAYRAGDVQAIVNNNVLTTGFDFPEIDCIVHMRPTASPGLWVQTLGRGTRPAPGKKNCLVLDFAGNTLRLGPINDPVLPRKKGKGGGGPAPVRLCEVCGTYNHASARVCIECGAEFPRSVKLNSTASTQELIAGHITPVETFPVDRVVYRLHEKEGRPDSMRVDYYSGLRRFSEFICLDHKGYPARLARIWWEQRCPWGAPPSVADGMKAIDYLRVPKSITVELSARHPEIRGYEFA